MSPRDDFNAHTWKEDDDGFHCLLFVGDLPGHMSLEFRAPTWRALKKLMREHGYESSLREKDVKEAWRMLPDTWVATA